MDKLKEIVVISGKGGTGKTTVASALAGIIKDKVIVDADVDASNMYLLLHPSKIRSHEFRGKSIAVIDNSKCTSCDLCRTHCRFNAIDVVEEDYKVDPISCDGCTLCELVCPSDAITMQDQIVGKWNISNTELGDFVYARLNPGAENSGNLVTMVRHQAKLIAKEKSIDTIVIDGPPGIGCPVTSSLSGTTFAVVVTEPSLSGISDMKRVLDVAKHFNIPTGIVINRYDVNLENSDDIEKFAEGLNIPVLAKIGHSSCIMDEISKGKLPHEKCNELREAVVKIYSSIKDKME